MNSEAAVCSFCQSKSKSFFQDTKDFVTWRMTDGLACGSGMNSKAAQVLSLRNFFNIEN